MKLSIIVPVFNVKEEVKNLLEMVSKQTVAPELVLVDGGSKDGTVDVIKSYQKKMKNVRLVPETGALHNPANARNVGLDNATGDICYFIDGDGIIEPRFAEKIVSEFEKSKADIVRFKSSPLKSEKFVSRIQEAYYWRDASRCKNGYPKMIVFKRKLGFKFDIYCGYGDDKLWLREVDKAIKKHSFLESNETLCAFQQGPVNLNQYWKRHIWYGRGGMIYALKYKDKAHFVKMILTILSIPFFPLMLVPMARGFIYAARVFKQYPQGIIIIPLLEGLALPIMAVGFWQYVLNRKKGLKGPDK